MRKLLLNVLLVSCFVLVGCSSELGSTSETLENPTTETEETSEELSVEEITEISETVEGPTVESEMFAFIDSFNANSETTLVFVEDFTPSDKSSLHYRTEFRLGAYSDAIGKSYAYEDAVVDLVGRQDMYGNIIIRVYMDGATIDQCVELVKYASPIMDPDIDSSELQETLDYITNNKTANGYYYADLGLLLLGSDSKGYELMLKMGND